MSALLKAEFPVGSIIEWITSTILYGWLVCGGQTVSRTTYAKLFAVIGTTYGAGDGSTTFSLPDIRGRAIAGRDDRGSPTLSFAGTLGGAGGLDTHTLTLAELPSHAHTYYGAHTAGSGWGSAVGHYVHGWTGSGGAQASGRPDAQNLPHENVQSGVVRNYIIRT